MNQASSILSRRESIMASLLVALGVVAVAAAATVLTAVQGGSGEPVEFTAVLVAPVTQDDIARAELAATVLDAIIEAERTAPAGSSLGGHRNSGRGWVFGSESAGSDQSIAQALTQLGLLDGVDPALQEPDMLVHQCGELVAVLAPSTVVPDPADQARWTASQCDFANVLIDDPAVFYVVGESSP